MCSCTCQGHSAAVAGFPAAMAQQVYVAMGLGPQFVALTSLFGLCLASVFASVADLSAVLYRIGFVEITFFLLLYF